MIQYCVCVCAPGITKEWTMDVLNYEVWINIKWRAEGQTATWKALSEAITTMIRAINYDAFDE